MLTVKRLAPIVGIGMLALTGCTRAIWRDFQDCGLVSVGFGAGLSAEARVVAAIQPSIGFQSKTFRLGHESRLISGIWRSDEKPFPVSLGEVRARRAGIGSPVGNRWLTKLADWRAALSPESFLAGEAAKQVIPRLGLLWLLSYRRKDRQFPGHWGAGGHQSQQTLSGYWLPCVGGRQLFNRAGRVEVGATVLLLSARVGVDPIEILDFVLGSVGCDIAGDDG